jgi:oligopeptide transport system substrate-binding protein
MSAGSAHILFRYAAAEPTGSIDPRTVTGSARAMATNLFEGLVGLDVDGTLKFVGAKSLDVLPDGLTYTFTLRPEVKWSDGRPVTARDYEYAYKTALNPVFGSETASILYPLKNAEAYNSGKMSSASEVGVRALDDYTLQLKLERRRPQLLQTMTTSFVFMPVPQHVVSEFHQAWIDPPHIVTNGPFTISEWTHNELAVLKRNPFYWERRPYIDEVRIALVGDPAAQGLTMYEAGDLDYAAVSGADVTRIQADKRYQKRLHRASVPRMYGLFMDQRRAPFNDLRVRQALYLAIDREGLKTISGGHLHPLYSPIPQLVPGHSDDIRLPGTLTIAKALLVQAGYPAGRGIPPLTLVVRNSSIETLQAEAIQSMIQSSLGIAIKVQALEPSAFRSFSASARDGNEYDIALFTATADDPDPSLFHNLMIGRNGEGWYRTYWHNPNYNRLLSDSDNEVDGDKRLAIYKQMDRLVVEDVGFIPVSEEDLTFIVNPAFSGIYIPFGETDPNVSRASADPLNTCERTLH